MERSTTAIMRHLALAAAIWLLCACAGSGEADSAGDGGSAGVASAGGSAGSGNAGSGNAGSGNAGSGNAGAGGSEAGAGGQSVGGGGAGGIAIGGSAGTAGAGGAGPTPPDWFDPQPPLAVTPHDEWRYIPVEGAVCANGKQSGFFINFSHTSADVLIFLLGGGICYDELSCAAHTAPVKDGMGDDPFGWWMGNFERTNGVFRRDNPNNPWKDASYVVLPHCTVDFHVANKESNYASTGKIQQRGYRNIQLAMNHVVPTFSDPHRDVTIAGFSAGGVGSVANYHQIASAFELYGHLPPFLVDDAGPVQPRPFFSANSNNAIFNGWQLEDTIGTWCKTCKDRGVHEALYWDHQLHPGLRSSVICAYADAVVMSLYTLFDPANALKFSITPIPTPPFTYSTMKPGLDALRTWSEGFATQGMHRNLLYNGGDRHGALTVGPIDEGFTPAIVPFLRAQLNRNDPLWYSPQF